MYPKQNRGGSKLPLFFVAQNKFSQKAPKSFKSVNLLLETVFERGEAYDWVIEIS